MSRKFNLLLAMMLLFISSVCFAYTDIQEHWASSSIESLSKIDILRGYEDGSFRPDDYITRAEFVTIVNRLLGNSAESTRYIADNNSRAWYYSEMKKAVKSGIIEGDPDGSVRPNDYITREEAIVILHRAFSTEPTENLRINSYSDSKDISEWSREAMALFVKKEYLKGYDDNTLKPKANITRAEVVTLIDRMLAEIVVRGHYTGNVYGNLLVNGSTTNIEDTLVEGDLIIAEGTNGEMTLKNIIVNGNLVIRTPIEIPKGNFKVEGNIIRVYESIESNEANIYSNATYGISFTLPEKARIIELTDEKQKINYRTKNLIVVQIENDNNTLYKSFETAEGEISEKYANLYEKVDYKEDGTAKIGYYYDRKENVHLILIKRNEIIYTITLYNVENENVADNILNSIQLTDGERVVSHEFKTYKNRNLFLEFRYIDYIGVDDSYNTNNIFEGQTDFMLFIQVTGITDMDKYSIEELKTLFDSLAMSEGDIQNSEIRKVYRYDAIDYTIKNDDKLNRSLYVVAGTKLYKFIFTGDASKVESIGNELFNDVINSIEM